MLPNVPAFPIAFYGALGAGAVVVPMNPLLKNREVAYYLGDSEPKSCSPGMRRRWRQARAPPGQACRCSRSTSPTWGARCSPGAPQAPPAAESGRRRRRGDPLHLGNHRQAQRRRAHARWPEPPDRQAPSPPPSWNVNPGDVTMGCLPLFHVFGLTCGLNATIVGGGTLTLLPRFDAGKALEIIGRDKVTILEGVRQMYAAMLHRRDRAGADTSCLRTCISGGAALPVEILRGFEQTFGCTILEGYGLSETSPVASFNHPDRVRKPGSIGTPVEGRRDARPGPKRPRTTGRRGR